MNITDLSTIENLISEVEQIMVEKFDNLKGLTGLRIKHDKILIKSFDPLDTIKISDKSTYLE